jgi:tocopherol O-methyltransferase
MTITLQQRIQQFYDASSPLWEQVWGEHMHHGYYGVTGTDRKHRRQAQIDLIEELLKWGEVHQPTQILDVGCGIGGSALYLAERYKAAVTGITLSPVQAKRATERAEAAGITSMAQFQVADALNMPFPDQAFDLVWSLESGEHMPDKVKFLQECDRVLKPRGTFIMATWCHRPTEPPQAPLTADEQRHLEKIYQVYCLPYVISLPEYEAIAQGTHGPNALSLQDIRTADWSTAVAPFWSEVIASALTPASLIGLFRSGRTTLQAALALGLMRRGYQRGLIRFSVLRATKA